MWVTHFFRPIWKLIQDSGLLKAQFFLPILLVNWKALLLFYLCWRYYDVYYLLILLFLIQNSLSWLLTLGFNEHFNWWNGFIESARQSVKEPKRLLPLESLANKSQVHLKKSCFGRNLVLNRKFEVQFWSDLEWLFSYLISRLLIQEVQNKICG